MTAPWSAACAAEIGADWLEQEIAPAGDFGRRAREREHVFVLGDEAQAREAIARVYAAAEDVPPETLAQLCEAVLACPDPGMALARVLGDATLTDADLFELSRFVDGLERVRNLMTNAALAGIAMPPWPQALALTLRDGRTPQRGFYLSDAFDPELSAARAAAVALHARFDAERTRLRERIAVYAGLEDVRDGEFVLMRERAPAPLPAEIRVLREAPTYWLCEVALDEPARTVFTLLNAAEQRVAEREEAVRARLSAAVRAVAPILEDAAEKLGAVDAFVARVRFAQRYRTCAPEVAEVPCVQFVDARFLPLERSLESRGHRYAPLSLTLDSVGVLTGPNMGGKTAALRTVGFVACCVALGVPVPAASARVSLFDDYAWIGIGTEAERTALLSSFGLEVTQLRDVLSRAPERALVLVDEFARTTSPREGRALLVALVEWLRATGVIALVATHFSRIAEDAGAPHFAVVGLREPPRRSTEAVDLDAAIERIAEVMDYRVHRVAADEPLRADALALAEVLGLDPALIARARAVL